MVQENPSHIVVFYSDIDSSLDGRAKYPHHVLPTLEGNLIHIHSPDLGNEVCEKQEPQSFAFVHLGSWMAFFYIK